jgi:phosphatidylethanolamine-binding protein (PEBP) family uncharacterized protein
MTFTKSSLATVLALTLGATVACTPASEPSDTGSGGSSGTGGSKATGGSSGSSSGGSSGSTGGSSGSTGGSSGSTGGSSGSSGGSSGSSGGSTGSGGSSSSGGSTGSGGGSGTGGTSGDAAAAEMGPSAGGKLMITIDDDKATSTPDRLCFKKEASNSGGNHSPKIDWSTPPAGTMSLVLMMEDLSNTTPHRVVCNMKPTETGMAADIKAMVPENAMAGTGHGKPMDAWYGPGAGGAAHKYEITIFALATPMLEGGCGPGKKAIPARDYLKAHKADKAVVLDWDAKTLWGNVDGSCK